MLQAVNPPTNDSDVLALIPPLSGFSLSDRFDSLIKRLEQRDHEREKEMEEMKQRDQELKNEMEEMKRKMLETDNWIVHEVSRYLESYSILIL